MAAAEVEVEVDRWLCGAGLIAGPMCVARREAVMQPARRLAGWDRVHLARRLPPAPSPCLTLPPPPVPACLPARRPRARARSCRSCAR